MQRDSASPSCASSRAPSATSVADSGTASRCLNTQLAPQALVQLAETLRVNQPYLGKLVIDLSGADAAYLSLRQAEETVGPISFQFRGISKALSWQLSVFSSCPNCRELSATYSIEAELKKPVRLVSTSLPALRHIQLVDSSRVRHAIDGIGLEYPSMRQDPQLSLSLQKLSVDDPDAPLSSFLMFLPIDASRLTELVLWVFCGSEDDIVKLVTLAPQLVKLSAKTPALDPVNHTLWQYATDVGSLRIPTRFFALVPNIVRLRFNGLAALSVHRLQLLAKDSPRIKHLSAQECVWLRDNPNSPIFPASNLAKVFPTFKHLEYAHLGTIPLPDEGSSIEPVEQTFEGMRARLAFDYADDTCPDCGYRP
ncbi:proteophosphoglycan ppg4 [Rhodotorula toruloides]|uniref:Proteophosphoglycan ppg4 n=1 Tax=Rhodotorula toruloides TaxID=5286 RepID=A0A511KED0_RHOTO|nr:proteophosphoglycan ppg4 [Rhodotorula toruloides]